MLRISRSRGEPASWRWVALDGLLGFGVGQVNVGGKVRWTILDAELGCSSHRLLCAEAPEVEDHDRDDGDQQHDGQRVGDAILVEVEELLVVGRRAITFVLKLPPVMT